MQLLIRRRGVTAAALLLASLGGAVACSSRESGDPQTPEVATSSAPSSGASSSDSGSRISALADVEPCSLLRGAELRGLGKFPDGQPEDIGTSRACRYQKDRQGAGDGSLSLQVAIRDNQGIDDASDMGHGIKHAEVDGRQYAQIPFEGGCTIAVGVTDTARVDVIVAGVEGTTQACNDADDVGAIIAPKLPTQ